MAARCNLLLGCLVIVLLVGSSASEPGVQDTPVETGSGSKKVDALNNGTNLSSGGDKVPESDSKPSKVVKANDPKSVDVDASGSLVGDLGSSGKAKEKGAGVKKDGKKSSSGEESTMDLKGSKGNSDGSMKTKDSAEECNPSSRCIAEEGKLVACLRFPGNDLLELSLLIQNKGKDPLTVAISPPDMFSLKDSKVKIKGKNNHEVMVSIGKLGARRSMYLSAGTDNCMLDFKDMLLHSSKDSNGQGRSQPNNFFRQSPKTAFILFLAFLILAVVGVVLKMRNKHTVSGEGKYQRIDMMELPVSDAKKPESSDVSEGWDESWGDGWDDEEVPKTPPMPVTPSVSSRGLAPRRATKEGWKD